MINRKYITLVEKICSKIKPENKVEMTIKMLTIFAGKTETLQILMYYDLQAQIAATGLINYEANIFNNLN